ncbi:hypothetical protein [Flavobacterium olei]
MYTKGMYQMQYAYINPKMGNGMATASKKYKIKIDENLPDGL